MARRSYSAQTYLRESIAQLAARFMAEGIEDFAQAKRKAARQLGAPDTRNLPDNREIEQALRVYQALYQGEVHIEVLRKLRSQALLVMQELEDFNPLLIGSVDRGTATAYSNIDLMLFVDSQKEVEIALLNRKRAYTVGEKRFRFSDGVRQVPVLLLSQYDGADVQLAIFAPADLRHMPLSPIDGRALSGSGLEEVRAWVE